MDGEKTLDDILTEAAGGTPAPEDVKPEDVKPEDPAPEDPAPEDPAPEDPAPEDENLRTRSPIQLKKYAINSRSQKRNGIKFKALSSVLQTETMTLSLKILRQKMVKSTMMR